MSIDPHYNSYENLSDSEKVLYLEGFIKSNQLKLGMANSRIQELEFQITHTTKEERKEIKKEEYCKIIKQTLKNRSKEIKKLRKEKNALIYELIKLKHQ